MKIKKILTGRRPARETPRNQGGGRAKRHSCEALNDVDGGKMGHPLKFGGLGNPQLCIEAAWWLNRHPDLLEVDRDVWHAGCSESCWRLDACLN